MQDTHNNNSYELQLIQNLEFIKNPMPNNEITSVWVEIA